MPRKLVRHFRSCIINQLSATPMHVCKFPVAQLLSSRHDPTVAELSPRINRSALRTYPLTGPSCQLIFVPATPVVSRHANSDVRFLEIHDR